MTERIVVVGADAGGMSAASAARRLRSPADLELLAFDRGHHASYSACGIPYYVGNLVGDVNRLVARDPETFRSKFAIEVRLRHEVVEVDLERRSLRVRDLEAGAERSEGFDQLVIATGAVPTRPAIPGIDAAGVHGVQTLDDGIALRTLVDNDPPRRAVVVGGGYVGLEMAEALVRRGVSVGLVEGGPQPMGTLDPEMGELVARALTDIGVELHLGERVLGFEEDQGRVARVVTTSGSLPAELVILGLGVRPNVALAEAAGVPVGKAGGIVVDPQMRTGAPGVWAAGDCVESFHRVSRKAIVVALGTHANKQGRVAGTNLGGGYATFPGVLGTAVSKICAVEVARTGLTEKEASEAGLEYETAVIEAPTRASYYPGATQMKVKVVAERGSGRLLGAQIVGEEGAAKRIDVFAVALWNEMSVEEITGLDLGYAPPFAPVWDPVLVAARKAAQRIRGLSSA